MCPPRRSHARQWLVAVIIVCISIAFESQPHLLAHGLASSEFQVQPPNVSSDPPNEFASSSLWMQSSLLHGVYSEIVNSNADDKCARDVAVIVKGISQRSAWALKILDTGPHVPSAFVYGNNFWFTASELCHLVNEPLRITISQHLPKRMQKDLMGSTSPVRMENRVVYANYSTGMQVDNNFPLLPIVHIGLCMPASCTDRQVRQHTGSYLSRRLLPIQNSFDIDMTVIGIKNMQRNDNKLVHSTSFEMLLAVLGFGAVVLVANIVVVCYRRNDAKHTTESTGGSDPNSQPTEVPMRLRIAKCFNIGDNLHELYFHQHPERDVAALAGIRSIVCIWVIVFHVNYHSDFTLSNLVQLIMKMEWFNYQPVYQAFLYVDVFFVVSSMLMVYNFLRNDAKRQLINENSFAQNAAFFLRHVFHRYVRLTPVLIVTMIFSDVIYGYLDEYSPFHMNTNSDLYCKETWWHNLLYTQNFLILNDICSSWSWYLACDMQYFCVGMLVLFVYAKSSKGAKTLYVLLTVSLLIVSFYLSYVNNLSYAVDVVMNNLNLLYALPWVRMNPFLGGAFFGWVLYKIRSSKWNPDISLVVLYWSVAGVIFVYSIFFTYDRSITTVSTALILSIGKYAFGLYIGSIILMCHRGNGGVLTVFLGYSLFQHISKLTYCMYMVSPLVITILHGAKEVSTHFDETQTFINVLATVMVSYAGAVLLAIFYELPFQKLSDEFVMKRARRIAA